MAERIQKITGPRGVSYLVRVEYPPDPLTSKRRQRSKAFKTKKEAEKALAEWLMEIERGTAVDGAKMTVGEYLKYWLDTYVKHNTRAKTYEGYEVCVRVHLVPTLGMISLQKLSVAHVQGFYMDALNHPLANGRSGTLSPRTVRLIHSVLREALQHAFEWGMVSRNVADATKPPRATRPQIAVWDADEVRRFLAVAHDDIRSPIWLVALTTGMRQGELLALRWQDIDFAKSVIHVRHTLTAIRGERSLKETKTGHGRRTISLSPACLTALREHRTRQVEQRLALGPAWIDNDAVFPALNGAWLDHGNLTRNFRTIMESEEKERKAERPDDKPLPRIPFHGLRHTHATLLLKEGVNVKVVSERLGHANIGITLDTYAHVLPSMQQEAADRIDAALFFT